MTVRPATAADVPALVRLINAAYRVEEFFVTGERTSESDVRERMSRPGARFLLMEDRGEIAGSIFLQLKGERGFFAMLSVDPARQKQGLGRALIEAAEAHCRAHGCRWLDLDVVNLRRELPPFYRKLGFAPYDTAPFHDPEKLKQPAHLLLMTKVLLVLCAVALAACGDAPQPAPAPPPATVAAPAPAPAPAQVPWDPWNDAKSRGIDFRAVGNEPGWYLEVDTDRWMRILYQYGEQQATVPYAKPTTAAGVTTMESAAEGHSLKVEITEGPCSDGMSDNSYPLNVVATVDGVVLKGCGRWIQ